MLNVKAARNIILEQCSRLTPESLPCETVPILEAFQRVLAEVVRVDRDYPPFARSMRDGYALLAQDVQHVPVDLRCIGEIKAGDDTKLELRAGEAVLIMTGTPVPSSADSVVMLEHTERLFENAVRILKAPRPWENVASKGSERLAGETALSPHHLIGPFAMGVLATIGKSRVRVFRKPTVGILSTGDELVDLRAIPGPGKIRNSNSYSLSSQVLRCGAVPVLLRTAGDQVSNLQRQIRKGLESDVLLVNGGVSMGKYDLVEPVFAKLGIKVHFESVSMRPGKPTVFATRDEKWIFGLPGNPVSTFVAFELFVRPVLRALQGLKPATLPLAPAILETGVVEKSGRTAFLPAKLVRRQTGFGVSPVEWKGSADVFSSAEANCLIIVPLEITKLTAGQLVNVLAFEDCDSELEGIF